MEIDHPLPSNPTVAGGELLTVDRPAAPRELRPLIERPAFAPSRWRAIFPFLLIGAAAFAVYANSFNGAFVFDDEVWIVENEDIQDLRSIGRLFLPSDAALLGGRPVVNLTLAINYAIGGTDVRGYHAVNLLIHILAAWTLFAVIRRTLLMPRFRGRFNSAATPLALSATLLWTVHPLQTAAVTYIIQRTESLVSLFYLLTIYCVIRAAGRVESGEWKVESEETSSDGDIAAAASAARLKPQASRLTPLWSLAAVVCCLLGMATKEVMVSAPLVVLLYDRTFLAGSFRAAIKRRWGLYLALAATWGVIVWALAISNCHNSSTGFKVGSFNGWNYLLTQSIVLVHYFQLVFWPTGLCLDYGWPPFHSFGELLGPGLLILALLGLTVWALVKRPALGFLVAVFLLILAPTSSFVPINDAAFDHRMYLPLATIAVLLVVGVGALCGRSLRMAAVALLVVALAGLGWTTIRRNADYDTAVAIWQDAVDNYPKHARSHHNLGCVLDFENRLDEAIEHYETAIRLTPGYIDAEIRLGNDLVRQGKIDAAIAHYLTVLKDYPNNVEALVAYGNALRKEGNFSDAIEQCEKALKIDPDSSAARKGIEEAETHRTESQSQSTGDPNRVPPDPVPTEPK